MAQQETTFRIKAAIEGVEGVGRLKDAVKRLNNTARPAAQDIGKLTQATRILAGASNRTDNSNTDVKSDNGATFLQGFKLTKRANLKTCFIERPGKSFYHLAKKPEITVSGIDEIAENLN